MLHKDAVFNAKNVRRNPVNRRSEPGKPAMHNDEVPIRNNGSCFISQSWRDPFDEVEKTLTPRLFVQPARNSSRVRS